jgi:hypothetical protein
LIALGEFFVQNRATTATAPTRPRNGAHRGMPLMPWSVGSGRGWHMTRTARKATIGQNEIRLASHGLVRALRSAPFMGGPHACKRPPTTMMG